MARTGSHQRPHHRRSKYGTVFPAGRGRFKPIYQRPPYIHVSPYFQKIPNIEKRILELIKNNPELAKNVLGRIALWGGCALAPSFCPILESVYLIYKGGKTVYNINELDIQSGDLKLFKMILNREITKEKIENISPQTIIMLGRKAEFLHHIINELHEVNISYDKEINIRNSLLSVSLKIDYNGFLTDEEVSKHVLMITPSLNINKERLLNIFAKTLRDSNPSLYKELLLQIVGPDDQF